jgi:hypothetical protein
VKLAFVKPTLPVVLGIVVAAALLPSAGSADTTQATVVKTSFESAMVVEQTMGIPPAPHTGKPMDASTAFATLEHGTQLIGSTFVGQQRRKEQDILTSSISRTISTGEVWLDGGIVKPVDYSSVVIDPGSKDAHVEATVETWATWGQPQIDGVSITQAPSKFGPSIGQQKIGEVPSGVGPAVTWDDTARNFRIVKSSPHNRIHVLASLSKSSNGWQVSLLSWHFEPGQQP